MVLEEIPSNILPALAAVVIIELVLKGFALWFSARAKQKFWFVALIIFNTMGILPAIYLLFFRRKL